MEAVAVLSWASLGSPQASLTRLHRACAPRARLIACSKIRVEAHQQGAFQHEQPATSKFSLSSSSCLTITGDIQCGELVHHLGTIMVKGNVCSGAVIRSSGDIVVLGKLEGEAHAGINGDVDAIIFTGCMKSTTLSIAGCDAGGTTCSGGLICKIVSLSDGKVRVEDAGSHDFEFAASISDRDHGSTVSTLYGGAKPWYAVDIRSMRKPAKVAAFTGSYISIVGVALLLFPERLFGLFFNLNSSVREWIRVGAVLAVVFGVYYIGTALGDAKGCNGADSFYISTIVGRMFIFFSFSWLVASGAGGLPLFIVGTVNLIGALTMLNALRRDAPPPKSC